MRTLKIVVALLLAAVGLVGCGVFGNDPDRSSDERIQQILDENASFTVLLRADVTEAQRRDVEAALRAVPGFKGVTFLDHEAAYRRMREAFSADPSRMPQIEANYLPESFEVSMVDNAAVQRARDDAGTVKNLPGVQDVVFRCTTVPECRAKYSPRPTASPS